MDYQTENITDLDASGASDAKSGGARLIYSILSSIRTSACILAAMALYFAASAALSHTGALAFFLRGPGLVRLFSNPVFLALFIALLINFAFSAFELFRGRRPAGFTPTHSLSLTQNAAQAPGDVRDALESGLGFSAVAVHNASGWSVMVKGFPRRYIALAFQAGVALFIVGAALTIIFAYEGSITLTPAQDAAIGSGTAQSALSLSSGTINTEYEEKAATGGRKGLLSAISSALDDKAPLQRLETDALYPIDARLDLTVKKDGARVMEKTIGIQDPLRYGFYTFSLSGIDQTFRVRVGDNPLTLSARDGEELSVPGLGFPVRFAVFRSGAIQRLDGSVGMISPHTRIKTASGTTDGGGDDLGRIAPGEATYINGMRLTLLDVTESPILSYRYNPGSWFLYLSLILIAAPALLRLFSSWRMAAYRFDHSAPIVRLDLYIETRGLFTSSKKLFKGLERLVTAGDIRPIPIPGERLK